MTAGAIILGISAGSSAQATSKTTKLLMYQQGTKPTNFDTLLAKVNKKLVKETGAELDIQFISNGEYSKKMSVIVASGENYDISLADNYLVNAQKGAYADLTKLAPKYAKKAYNEIDKSYIEGNTIDGKLYAFPVNANVYSQQVVTFDKGLLEKYGLSIDHVKSYSDLAALYKVIEEKDPDVVPLATGPNYKVFENLDNVIDASLPFVVKTDGDTTKIYNKYALKEVKQDLETMRSYYKKGYITKDAATSKQIYNLKDTNWFSQIQTQGPFDYGDTILSNAAGRELVSVPITDAVKKVANVRMANYVVSATSKNKVAAVKVLNALNSDKDILNTLIYGEEGTTWKKTSSNKAKLLTSYDSTEQLSAWNTGNNANVYPTDNVTSTQIEARDTNISNAISSPILGFNFDSDSVKTEITNITSVMNQYQLALNTGSVDTDSTLKKMNTALKTAGINKVLTEMQKQYDIFLKAKN
jgi:putative aldouronate transport system substrate-binding protein